MKKVITIALFMLTLGSGVFVNAQDNTLDFTEPPTFGAFQLEAGFQVDPFIVTVVSGGDVNATALELGADCLGFAAPAPDFRLIWTGDTQNLRVFFLGFGDATLLINQPDTSWVCSDDSYGTLNPTVNIPGAPEGQYDIWVGSVQEGVAVTGYLMITEIDSHPTNVISTLIGATGREMDETTSTE